MKVGASVVVARRAGFLPPMTNLISFRHLGMPIASGQYWNSDMDAHRAKRSKISKACREGALLRHVLPDEDIVLGRKNGRNPRKGKDYIYELHSIIQEVVAGKDRVCTRSCKVAHSLWFRAVWAFS